MSVLYAFWSLGVRVACIYRINVDESVFSDCVEVYTDTAMCLDASIESRYIWHLHVGQPEFYSEHESPGLRPTACHIRDLSRVMGMICK
jgi:hypothetical protein